MCPELPFQLFLSSLFYWGFAFPLGSLSLVPKFFFLHFLWCRSVGDEHFWPLYLFLKCSYFTFILSGFFPLGIIFSAEFFWFIDFSFYWWLSFMLYISGHFYSWCHTMWIFLPPWVLDFVFPNILEFSYGVDLRYQETLLLIHLGIVVRFC